MSCLSQISSRLDSLPMVTADYLAALAESKGRQEMFAHRSPQSLKALREHALVESAVSSNRIEGVEIERSRAEPIILGHARFRDRPEEEVAGYRKALELIHEKSGKLAPTEATILRLHKTIRGQIGDAGKYKERAEPIIERYPDGRSRIRFMPLDAKATPAAVREIAALWSRRAEIAVPVPILLAAFNLDFLCIHPFRDGNGRVSRLLLLLQSYQLGFEVGRYISLERLIERDKERYYETLEISSRGWHEGKHDPWPYINFILYILKSAYRELERSLESVSEPRGAKTRKIRETIDHLASPFAFSDLEKICLGVSRDMLRKVVRDLQKEGKLESLGRGPGAVWRKKGITPKKR